jgi:hypothetical protein
MTGPRQITSMRKALDDPTLLGRIISGESWWSWRLLLCAMLGEALDDEERATYTYLTGGREWEPLERVRSFFGIIGRRGGKSRAIAVLAVYMATMIDYSSCISLGERGVVLVLATNVKQAKVCFKYILAILETVPGSEAIDCKPHS